MTEPQFLGSSKETVREIRNYKELNDNEIAMSQNLRVLKMCFDGWEVGKI